MSLESILLFTSIAVKLNWEEVVNLRVLEKKSQAFLKESNNTECFSMFILETMVMNDSWGDNNDTDYVVDDGHDDDDDKDDDDDDGEDEGKDESDSDRDNDDDDDDDDNDDDDDDGDGDDSNNNNNNNNNEDYLYSAQSLKRL